MQRAKEIVIVLAEDDASHARLIEKNLHTIVGNRIVKCDSGQAALEYLRREEQPTQQHLLLLDLNMPVMDGYQVLEQLKGDQGTQHIPVIVLSTTDEPREIQRCYDLGCNAYVVKSADYGEFAEEMRRLGKFLTVARMPGREPLSWAVPCGMQAQFFDPSFA